jgi:hypothetical protein
VVVLLLVLAAHARAQQGGEGDKLETPYYIEFR